MSGLAEILEENQRLRESLAAMKQVVKEKDQALVGKDQALVDKDQVIADKDAQIAKQDAMLVSVTQSAEELAQQLAFIELQRKHPVSQRYIPSEQDVLPFPSDVAPPPRAPVHEPDDEADSQPKPAGRSTKKPRRRNREAFRELGSRNVVCKAPDDATCANCGGPLKVIGQATSFRIDWVPGHFVVDDVSRDKCACPACPGQGVLTVPGPYALDRAMCADGLVARVIVDKHADHLPLNRQAKRMGREGFQVGTNTLAGWVGSAGKLLRHVAEAVKQDLLNGKFLQGDDTGHPVQDGGDGRLRKGRLWAFTDQQQVFYAFTPTKAGVFPAQLLEGFAGELLLVDGGSEFNQVVAEQRLKRGGCWSHLRKYFFEARHSSPREAAIALVTIHDLFMIERECWGQGGEVITAARTGLSTPLVDGFFAWATALSTTMRPKSKLGEALTYAINQQSAMRTYLSHSEMPLHNNLSELMLRQPVVGRKNWLFSRTEGGAEVAADCYTLIGSCMLQGIDPHDYLVDVLRRLPDHPSTRVAELTPEAWAREKRRT